MPETASLVAIVVTYNRLSALQTTLTRLLESAPEHLTKVVICDNASSDGTAEWLSKQSDPRIEVFRTEANLGGAGGFEEALLHVQRSDDPDWYLLMDDDAYPAPGTLAAFHGAPRNTHELWFSSVRYPDGEICEMNRPWLNPFWSVKTFFHALLKGRDAFHLDYGVYEAESAQPVDGGSFVGLFASRKALAMAGAPRGELFIYADDVLFTLKVRQKGGLAAFDPTLAFCHDCKTFENEAHVFSPLWKAYFYHRNITLVYREVAGPILFWPVLVAKALSWRLRAKAYGADAPAYRRILRKAIGDALYKRFHDTPTTIKAFTAPRES